MKKNKGFAAVSVISAVVSVVNLIAACIAVRRLPETVPVHFNAQWICDGMGSRWILLIPALLPLIAAAVGLIVLLTGRTKQPKITAIAGLLTELYLISIFWLIYPAINSGVIIGGKIDSQPFATVLILLFAVLFVIFGNYMPIIQPNKTIGLRVPWTLNNPQCWRRTHRFAGKIWVVTGLLMCVIILTALALHHAGEAWSLFVFAGMTGINLIVPCAYAYQHRNDA